MFSICSNCCINHEQIKSHSERISKIKLFIDQYNWKEINFPSYTQDMHASQDIIYYVKIK